MDRNEPLPSVAHQCLEERTRESWIFPGAVVTFASDSYSSDSAFVARIEGLYREGITLLVLGDPLLPFPEKWQARVFIPWGALGFLSSRPASWQLAKDEEGSP